MTEKLAPKNWNGEMRYWRARDDWQIVSLLDGGMNPKRVAIELGISVWSVYRANRRYVSREEMRQKSPNENRDKTTA